MSSRTKKPKSNPFAFLIQGIGIGLVILSFIILARLFQDPLSHEIQYAVSKVKVEEVLAPPNTDFAIVIDKIGASANIVKSVDPYDSQIYQRSLRDGVAHAKGTKLPGEDGNIFLFAHSSADILTAERYNSVFYLMHHLVDGDVIKVWKDDKEYDYTVSEKLFVSPSDTKYLTAKSTSEQLILMTCWPPGTTLKRLIIIAQPI